MFDLFFGCLKVLVNEEAEKITLSLDDRDEEPVLPTNLREIRDGVGVVGPTKVVNGEVFS